MHCFEVVSIYRESLIVLVIEDQVGRITLMSWNIGDRWKGWALHDKQLQSLTTKKTRLDEGQGHFQSWDKMSPLMVFEDCKNGH